MRIMPFSILFSVVLLFISKHSVSQAGNLDLTFANTGFATTAIGNFHAAAWSVKQQVNGKIIVGGIGSANGETGNFSLVRYNSNGFIDNSFGTNGIVTTAPGNDNEGRCVAVQSDGKILLAGFSSIITYDFSLVRYFQDGSLDTTFGTEGFVTTDILNSGNYATSMAVQADGKIVLAGMTAFDETEFDYTVVRYTSNGSVDSTFGDNGIVMTDVAGSNDEAYCVVIQNDGKIIVAGGAKVGSEDDFAMVRYNSDGSLDNSFGNGGKVTTDLLANDYGNSVVLDAEGKIYLVGYANNPGAGKDIGIVSYNPDGSLNTEFGTNGIVTQDLSGTDDEAYSVAVNNQGKIIVAGGTLNLSGDDIFVLSFNHDGTPDTMFGNNGKVITDLNSNETARSMIIQTDGKIVVSGYSEIAFATVRYLGDGTVDIVDHKKDFDFEVFQDRQNKAIILRTSEKQLNSDYQVTDASGKTITHGKIISENTTISTENISSGIYFVQVLGLKAKKIICF